MTPADAARLARSVLSCPDSITLRVDEQRDALTDEAYDVTCDVHGSPVFSASDASALLAAARSGAGGVVEIGSGLGASGAGEPRTDLFLQGRLTQRGSGCQCCGDPRALVALEVSRVTLFRDDRPVPVDVALFRDRGHVLNPGYLQRTAEHTNEAHELELRSAMASTFGLPLQSLLAASLLRVDAAGVDVSWLDDAGGHTQRLDFLRTVSSPQELGAALRSHLHAGIC
ncbi:hypothetical protein SAMN05192575_10376 [Nocardioides alpinus]|uniref:DUF2470 domain-containing protein n=1 Tax=Nocardioides alpinus TaxID=748909 RepID=A0A1I0XYN6_9ACTN|nr:DUF2470 domain-containing protein [Nocardioides alpinus]PKH42801.1 hypothetical protein CXG46_05970 [Nocardioides alpinus]SFB05268.1 hypothetical protein SAMN05192575_10376 [Nocardioides alpinus]